jgi:hypothetical protein
MLAGHTKSAFHAEPERKYTLNATELARDKFNALFAAHDAKDIPLAVQPQRTALRTVKKPATKHGKP